MFSDDSDTDYVSLSPDVRGETPTTSNAAVTDVRSIGQPSVLAEGVNDGGRTGLIKESVTHNTISFGGDNCVKSRKRLNSDSLREEEPRKKRRSDIDPMCAAIDDIELAPNDHVGKDSTHNKLVNGKGRKGKRSKGKEKARGEGPCTKVRVGTSVPVNLTSDPGESVNTEHTVEELLASGHLCKDEVSQILFRLPDGSRLQKSFLCNHPISVSITTR